MEDRIRDHETRIRMLEDRFNNLAVTLEKHLTWAETIWGEQQKTTARIEALITVNQTQIGKVVDDLIGVSKKLWMILGACSFAAASTGVVTWLLSK